MSSEHDTPSVRASSPTESNPSDPPPDRSTPSDGTSPGPSLLAERSLLGIFVHLITVLAGVLPFMFVVSGVVYAVSDHEFTRANARNAFNWHLFTFATSGVAIGAFVLVAVLTDLVALPGPVETVVLLPAFALVAVAVLLVPLTLVFCLVATGKAILGDAWSYPLAPDFVGRVTRVRKR